MFTIKLMNHYNPEETDAISNTITISCARYDVYRKDKLALLTVYKDFTSQPAVEFRVHGKPTGCLSTDIRKPLPPYSEVAYIENESGKTIDKVGPYEPHDWYGEAREPSCVG